MKRAKIREVKNPEKERIYLKKREINAFFLEKTCEPEGVFRTPKGRLISFEGFVGSIIQWGFAVNKDPGSIRNRIRQKASLEDALFDYVVPIKSPHPKDEGRHFQSNWSEKYILFKENLISLQDLSEELQMKSKTLYSRIYLYKQPLEDALNNDPTRGIVHGTRKTYDYYKCRCHECKTANSLYHRMLSKKKKTTHKSD